MSNNTKAMRLRLWPSLPELGKQTDKTQNRQNTTQQVGGTQQKTDRDQHNTRTRYIRQLAGQWDDDDDDDDDQIESNTILANHPNKFTIHEQAASERTNRINLVLIPFPRQ